MHGDLGSGGDAGSELVGTSCEGSLAASALPDAGSDSFDLLLSGCICTFPQGGQTYLALCWSSNFLTIFLMAPPYLVPYLPVTPAFLVLLAIKPN